MKWHRVQALLIRHLYLYQRSVPRIMDICFWPVMTLLLWGFLSVYLEKVSLTSVNILTILLGAVILWEFLDQSQRTVSLAFLEDVWEKNFLNIFITPLRVSEFLLSTALLGVVRVILVSTVLTVLAWFLYHFTIFQLGFYIIPLVAILLFFGWVLGVFTTAIILRFGTSAQVLAFGLIFLLQPFSAVFYPVSALPQNFQYVAKALPTTWVFEGMRSVVSTGMFPLFHFSVALGLSAFYFMLIIWFFYRMFARVKNRGLMLKLD